MALNIEAVGRCAPWNEFFPGRMEEIFRSSGNVCAHPEIEALPLEPVPKRRNRGMTYKKLYERIRLGFGQGHSRYYSPWLQIRRKNPSPESNQVVTWLPPLERAAHFFSRGEYHLALLLLWLGVLDLREQFPIWPLDHPHPLDGGLGMHGLPATYVKGLLKIAAEAGINHGYEIGSKQPYVATLDILVTVPGEDMPAVAVFSSKPIDDADAAVKWRTLERLELERRYSIEIGGRYYVSSSALVPLLMAGQLEWWLGCSTLSFNPALKAVAEPFADAVMKRSDLSISESVHLAAPTHNLSIQDAWCLFRHCAWTQKIDIDPSQKILTSYPLSSGGRALRCALQEKLFGRAWS